jgi:thiol-disulfide isomerase/thioredoxin
VSPAANEAAATGRVLRHRNGMKEILLAALIATVLAATPGYAARVGEPAPEVVGDVWINAEPQTLAGLRGRVVLVEFWTFACHNCKNVEASLRAWHERYAALGLTVVAVHSPEFDFEHSLGRVRRYVREHGIEYAVCVDNRHRTWKRYANHYWPTMYLIGRDGIVRHVRIGEGGEQKMEAEIRQALAVRPTEDQPSMPSSSSNTGQSIALWAANASNKSSRSSASSPSPLR